MKRTFTCSLLLIAFMLVLLSFHETPGGYEQLYQQKLAAFTARQDSLVSFIEQHPINGPEAIAALRSELQATRTSLKGVDFWLRYLEPTTYKKINGPLPVEWETEVFEKFEQPYRREGAGLTLAQLYLDEPNLNRDTLLGLIRRSQQAMQVYHADSVTRHLSGYHHFYLCNRLYLLNLAAIYTTGFECPDTAQIIPELRQMLHSVQDIYAAFNAAHPQQALPEDYLGLYRRAIAFCAAQPSAYSAFDHFHFLKDYVNPLYALNQQLIRDHQVVSRSMIDYSLNKSSQSIFSKDLYNGQNHKGIFLRVRDSAALAAIDRVGKQLFYDPILSGNNQRSCASCHKPGQHFADTFGATALQYNHKDFLPRNTPSLINAGYNHLIMADGQHFTLQHQTKSVITNLQEMGCTEAEVLRKVLSCAEYKAAFTQLLAYTPQEPEITFDHIASAITAYYGKFSKATSPFDDAMNGAGGLDAHAMQGFNLFMSKAQCGTCHFVPQFNGVKPPYIGSEFEVLGVPADAHFKSLSKDAGRFGVNPAPEMQHAFRTGTVRNAAFTAPYMHNGVFRTLEEVIDFYDAGGGAGHGLAVDNQTLSADSLHLSKPEKAALIHFIHSLNETIVPEPAPKQLPRSGIAALNRRKVGGIY